MKKHYRLLPRGEEETNLALKPDSFLSDAASPGRNRRFDEEIFKLVQRVFMGNGSGPPRLVVFAGIEPGSGCTWVCAHAGEALAGAVEVPVCMVDANQLAPGLHRYFGIDNIPELRREMLHPRSMREMMTEIRGKNMWLMPYKQSCLLGMFGLEKYRARLSELCSEFEYVLVDAPPLSESAQALTLGKIADGIVLILQANATHREAARRAKESLQSAGANILGAVLNKRTYPVPDVLYKRL